MINTIRLFAISLSLFFIFQLPAFSQVPDLGDNTAFVCVELEDDLGCFGQIAWLQNPVSNVDKGGKYIRAGRGRRLAKRYARQFKRQRNISSREGNQALADIYEAARVNSLNARRAMRSCQRYEDDSCASGSGGNPGGSTGGGSTGGGTGGGDTPLSEACEVAENPQMETQRSNNSVTQRIVNGAECTAATDSPVVLIRNQGSPWCTGTAVKNNVVITAAHCIPDFCEQDISIQTQGGITRTVSTCVAKPEYSSNTSASNDVAVLILSSNLPSSTHIASIYQGSSMSIGATTVAAGYGRNSLNSSNLLATFNTLLDSEGGVLATDYNQGEENEGTTCNGDSGGPLFMFLDGAAGSGWYLVGATSSGTANDCALPGTSPSTDISFWADLSEGGNLAFIAANTSGVVD